MEEYILKQIKEIKDRIKYITDNRSEFSISDYMTLFNRYLGQIDILYQVLTAHDNTYLAKNETAQ